MTSILITDGNTPTRLQRARVLREAGYKVIEHSTAVAALSDMRHGSATPALVLLEVGLPDGNGFELCEQIKLANPSVRVVLISDTYRSAQARRDGFLAGADAYLVEPTPAARLVDTVRRLVEGEAPQVSQPGGIVRTTRSGSILWVNNVAARLLNIGERAAPGRNLLTFFNGDRLRLQEELVRASAGQVCELEASLRPRERRPLDLRVDLSTPPDGQPGELEWLLEPLHGEHVGAVRPVSGRRQQEIRP